MEHNCQHESLINYIKERVESIEQNGQKRFDKIDQSLESVLLFQSRFKGFLAALVLVCTFMGWLIGTIIGIVK